MADNSNKHYPESFFTEAAARRIIPEFTRGRLIALWHGRARRDSFRSLYYALFILAIIGIGFGLVRAVPEILESNIIATIGSALTTAAHWAGRAIVWCLSCVGSILLAVGSALRYAAEVVASVFAFIGAYIAIAFRAVVAAGLYLYSTLAEMLAHTYNSLRHPFAKIGATLAASLLATPAGDVLRKSEHAILRRLGGYVYTLGALLFLWAAGVAIRYCVLEFAWEGLEVPSIAIWSVAPLMAVALGGKRPIIHQAWAAIVVGVHILIFYTGVSGNVIVALEICIAVSLISLSEILAGRSPAFAEIVRYISMAIICFVLYCSGFVWDLPALLEFRHGIRPGTGAASLAFLLPLFGVAATLVGLAYLAKRHEGGRNAAVFTLLLLLTLFFAYFATGLLLWYIPVGQVYDLASGSYRISVFTSNMLIAVILSWTVWFLWCLWMMIESKIAIRPILVEIAVIALLCSLETRYIEIVRNFSFAAGLVMLPPALLLVATAGKIIGKWFNELKAE